MKKTALIFAALALLTGAFLHAASAPAAPDVIKIKPYLLDTCIVSGDKIGSMGTPIVIIQNGQEVRFCCNDCPKDFAKEPAKYLKMIADAEKKLPAVANPAKEAVIKPYPLDVCVIMGKKLGSMGPPVVIQYNGQEVKLCCKDCVTPFYKDPLGTLQKIADAQKKTATSH